MSPMEAGIINATLRQLWSIAVSLLIFLCSIGSGGNKNYFFLVLLKNRRSYPTLLVWCFASQLIEFFVGFINKFLSLPVFIVTSRLTYSMYLVHPYVMIYYRYGKMITDYYHDWELVSEIFRNSRF